MGKPDLTEAQFRGLCSAFSDPSKTDDVLWKQFVSVLEDPSKSVCMLAVCFDVCIAHIIFYICKNNKNCLHF